MRLVKIILGAGLGALLTSCATTPTTPFIAPQVTIKGELSEVKTEIMNACVRSGGMIESNTDDQIVCSKPMDNSFGNIVYRALTTPDYSTNPEHKVLFSMSETKEGVHVFVNGYTEFQTAFGQTNKRPIMNAESARIAQDGLNRLKHSIENK